MPPFERLPEIDKSLKQFLTDYQELSDLVGNNVFYFRYSMPKGKSAPTPCIVFRRAGGVYGNYRYYFSLRAKDPETLANLRRIVIRRLLSPINLSTGENIVESYLDGQLVDGGDESVGWFESSFYIVFELLEAGYG